MIPDYCCENCNKVAFCTTSSSVSNIAEMLIFQLVIFRYNSSNNRSRKLILNLKIDDTVTLFETSTVHGIILHQGSKASK